MSKEYLPQNNFPGKFDAMTYTDRFGSKRELEHTFVLEPGRDVIPNFSSYVRDVESVFGKETMDKVRGKTIVLPYVFAGWGHMFQTYLLAEGFRAVGARVVMADLQEIATPKESYPFQMKQMFLKAFHADGGKNLQWNLNRKFALDTWLGDRMRVATMELALSHIRGTGWEQHKKPTFLDRATKQIGMLMEKNKSFRGFMARTAVGVDSALFDKEFTPSLVHFCDSVGAQAVIATHSTPARSLVGTAYEKKTILAIPDDGYGISPEFLAPMVAMGSGITTGTPSEKIAQYLKEYFSVSKERIIPNIGTVSLAEQSIAREKWNRPERVILLSTSGNGAHMEYIAQAVEQFADELNRKETPYRLIVFLGDQPDEKIEKVLAMIKEKNLEHRPHLAVIRTTNAMETAAMKWWCKLHAHVEIAKPGEQPLDNPLLGTVTIALPAGFANEPVNLAVSLSHWQASLPSSWPANVYEYWRKTPEFRGVSVPGFDRPFANIVDYLEHLFGNNERFENYLWSYATQGRYQAPQDALLWYLVKGIDIMQPSQDGGRSEHLLHMVMDRRRKEQIRTLIRSDWRHAFELGDLLTRLQLESMGKKSLDEFVSEVAPKTAVVTLHGGAGTRWGASFDTEDGKRVAQALRIPESFRNTAKGLVPVANLLHDVYPGATLPVLGYDLHAVRPLVQSGAAHTFIYSGADNDRDGVVRLLDRMGFSATNLVSQQVREGKQKVSGHGDAIIGLRDHLKTLEKEGKEYLVVQFGGVPSSTYTVLSGLLSFDFMSHDDSNVVGVLPTAKMETPAYPTLLSSSGAIQMLGHKKLLGEESANVRIGQTVRRSINGKEAEVTVGGSNVGVWMFRLDAILPALDRLEQLYKEHGNYLFLPGHDQSGVDECALDDIVAFMAQEGKEILQVATAHPDEITHSVKQLVDIREYLDSMKNVLERDRLRLALNNASPR